MNTQDRTASLEGRMPRLYVGETLAPAASVALSAKQAHYLANVLRRKPGDMIVLFNGRDGEWSAEITRLHRKQADVVCAEQMRAQTQAGDLHYLFAPLKSARLDYLAQKATEMGVARMTPVFTEHTQMRKLNLERIRANAVEAAEQCGIMSLPQLDTPSTLSDCLANWPETRSLIFCDEAVSGHDPIAVLRGLDAGPVAVLIGPEGGFSDAERDLLRSYPFVTALSLGPRIMRADTAAVAALALIQAVCGDWSAQS